jgi:hypothetical protein
MTLMLFRHFPAVVMTFVTHNPTILGTNMIGVITVGIDKGESQVKTNEAVGAALPAR